MESHKSHVPNHQLDKLFGDVWGVPQLPSFPSRKSLKNCAPQRWDAPTSEMSAAAFVVAATVAAVAVSIDAIPAVPGRCFKDFQRLSNARLTPRKRFPKNGGSPPKPKNGGCPFKTIRTNSFKNIQKKSHISWFQKVHLLQNHPKSKFLPVFSVDPSVPVAPAVPNTSDPSLAEPLRPVEPSNHRAATGHAAWAPRSLLVNVSLLAPRSNFELSIT